MSKRVRTTKFNRMNDKHNKKLAQTRTSDSSETKAVQLFDGKWSISAVNIGSLTQLDVSLLEINQEHFEFNAKSEVLICEIKVCVPWNEIVKMECHFGSDLHALVIHVEELWGHGLIIQLRKALSQQIPLELDPKNAIKHKRVISVEFAEEPPPQHITMMEYYIDKHHSDSSNRTNKSCSCAYINNFLPQSADHSETAVDTDVEDSRILLVYPLPPAQPSITVKYHDWECLMPEEFLNDAIIDFYLKYIHNELISPSRRVNIHLFKSCFYKTLIQPTNTEDYKQKFINASERMSNSEKMHQHVKEFTKSMDLFSRDYIIVPINEHEHWYLAIICYPWLMDPRYDNTKSWKPPNKHNERSDEQDKTVDEKDVDGVLSNQREQSTVPPMSRRPCILMYDSLVTRGRNKVVNNIRNYLAEEWKTKNHRTPRSFNKQNFPGFFVDGPLQENFCDSGMFLLQFAEKFLETPIMDYRFPVEKRNWFSQQDVTRKRTSIGELIIRLESKEDSPKLSKIYR